MTSEIQSYNFRGVALRILTDETGEPWFIAKDVCDILEIRTNSLRAILEPDEISELGNDNSIDIAQNGGKSPLIISEAGLYSLALKSRKPEAKEFQRWVTHEVLPQIRRTGGYIPTTDMDDDMTILAKAVMIGQRTMEEQRRRIEAQESRIRELEPKALFADAVAASDGTCLVGELAKMLRQNGEEPMNELNPPTPPREVERLHPAMLGAIGKTVREELAACEEQPVFDHPQDMMLGGAEDWHPRFKVTPAFGDGRFLLTIQLGASYGLSFHCDAHDLHELAEAAAQALKTARPEGDEPSMTRPAEDAYGPHPTTSIPRDSHTSLRRDR